MSDCCNWPFSNCKWWEIEKSKPDPYGREWMHCEEGLNFSKASMSRFIMFCLANNVEIGDLHPFNRKWPRCQVSASIRIHPSLFEAFEKETGGKLRKPPVISLN
jgi:hypothetical protein